MIATAKVGRDNFGGGGTVFIRKATGSVVAPFAPKITPVAVTPPGGFNNVLQLKRNPGLHGDQWRSSGRASPSQQNNTSESESPQSHTTASL
jgi:hypothetical protein